MPKEKQACKNARPNVQKRTHKNDLVIAGNVAWRTDLSWDIKILYGVIRVLSKNEYYCCFASNDYLCETLQKDNGSTIRRYLNKLEQLELIKRDSTYIIDDYDNFQYSRAIVPTDFYNKFSKKKDEILDLQRSLKNNPKGVQNCTPTACKNAHHILNMLPIKENNTTNTTSSIYNPQPPCKVGNNADTLIGSSQIHILGTFGNVRLTEYERTAFSGEFGEGLASALIEQLDAYIQSSKRRQRRFAKSSTNEIYATLRDWALRKTFVINAADGNEDKTGGTYL